jgi:hypothetical protein
MIKRKTRYHVLVGALVALLVVTAGSLIGSNMGFKATRTLDYVAGVQSRYCIALPHLNPWTGSGGADDDSDTFLTDLWTDGGPVFAIAYWDNNLAANGWQERMVETVKGAPDITGSVAEFDLNGPLSPGGQNLNGYILRVQSGTVIPLAEPYY